MGGRVAINFASRYQHLLRSLVIEDMHLVPFSTLRLSPEDWDKARAFPTSFPDEATAIRELGQYYSGAADRVSKWKADGRAAAGEGEFRVLVYPYTDQVAHNALLATTDARESFSAIVVPTLLFRADQEAVVDDEGEAEMTQIMPTLVVARLPGSSHSVHRMEDEYLEVLLEFVDAASSAEQ